MRFSALDQTQIHLFSVKGRHFAFDVNSCVFFETDEVSNGILQLLGTVTSEVDLVQRLAPRYPGHVVWKRLSEMLPVIQAKELFSDDPSTTFDRDTPPRLSTLCLNVAQKCNLSCRYCFAHGNYGQDKLMTPETSAKSVDFLIKNSIQKDLSISFFGGEPLLNLPVIRHTVSHAKRAEQTHGKYFRFHITTNGTLLTKDILRFLDNNQFSMIISLDGPRDVNDSMRQFRNGRGSYNVVYRNLMKVLAFSPNRPLTVRSTFTHQNMDVDNLAMHLFQIGCKDVSVEPCATEIEDLQITREDLKTLKQHYDMLADRYLAELAAGRRLSFFHLRQAMDQVRRKRFSLTQCGAANGYLAVGADGKLYPCHKFVGNEAYVVGDVFGGIKNQSIPGTFHSAYVGNKKKCMKCWARYACGGGCHAHAIAFNNDILEPYDIECDLMKHRLELGAYLYATLSESAGCAPDPCQRRSTVWEQNQPESLPYAGDGGAVSDG